MTVEIRELVIRAVADDGRRGADASGPGVSAAEREAIVEACVREVLRVLKRREER